MSCWVRINAPNAKIPHPKMLVKMAIRLLDDGVGCSRLRKRA